MCLLKDLSCLFTGNGNMYWLEIRILKRHFQKVDLAKQALCAPSKMTTQKHPLYVFMYHSEHFHRPRLSKPNWPTPHLLCSTIPHSLSMQYHQMSVFQMLDLLRLVSSGSVSLWCQLGIKGTVALCQRLDLFSPPSRKRQGPERDEELTIWRLIISGLTEIGQEARPAVDTHIRAFLSRRWVAGRFARLIWATKHKHWLVFSRELRKKRFHWK